MHTRNRLCVLLRLGTILMGFSPFAAHAADIHVPGDKLTIQAGINAANDGDTVVVKNGTYTGDGNKNLDFAGRAITVRSESNDPTLCIIDGGGSGRGFIFHTGETAAATVSGLTIQNCSILNPDSIALGGGMYCENASPTVTNCAFIGNAAFGGGGMANTASSSPTVTNCTFINNSTDEGSDVGGGGMENDFNCSPTVTNCTFIGNAATSGGGAMTNYSNSPSVINCIFSGNVSDAGGAMFFAVSNASVINCTFSGNSALVSGGGVFSRASNPTLINCTFSANSGGGITVFDNPATLINCILWGDTGGEIAETFTARHCIIQGLAGLTATPDADGNFSADPGFVRAPFTNGPADYGDLRLQAGSPAIDAGDDAAVPPGITTDLGGLPRIRGSHVDIGAYEFFVNTEPVANGQSLSLNQDGSITITLTGRDSDRDTLTYAVVSSSAHGTLSGAAPNLIYTPNAGYVGSDSFTFKVTDPFGASSTATINLTIKDKTPPVITTPGDITATAASTAGAVVTFNVTASDNADGTVPVLCNPPSGSLFAPGKTTVICTASDKAGNMATATFLVWVQYAWSGVFQPIHTDGSSVFKAGSTVPVKFALTGASAGITNLHATLTYARISNGDPGVVNEATSTSAATSGNLFRYDASSGQYIFNWSTKGLTSGKYRLTIDLGDGIVHTVDVGLK